MADDWPFLHLNIVSPPIDRMGANEEQELSLLPFDSSHLEAWTNINFQFDESPVVRFDNTNQSTNNFSLDPLSNSSTIDTSIPSSSSRTHSEKNFDSNLAISNPFRASSKLSFPLPNEHSIPPFLDDPSVLANSHELAYLSQAPPLSTSDQSIGNLTSNNRQAIIEPTSIDNHNGKPAVSPNASKFATHDQHSSPQKHDTSSPANNNDSNGSNISSSNNNQSANDDDDANRVAYDEDKRRRNTLASARFRMKKKMKEQEIERTAREMRERVSDLEKQVDSLKQENKWLRGLIVDSTASKLVSAQVQETAELSQLDSTSGKRPRPTLSPTSDSINVPVNYQKRSRLNSSSTSATTNSKSGTSF
ncbi:hypothetical protein, variant [Puccinia triticina 1-1 BBBD Race 1]|uniref:BZIP domain-containing protein n=2 Tax=Puccinia triticina TaxID=208348 RepID=A0A180GPP6_PUCT1|nr:uncharacterized protein PtA15_12A408 [Puccinia triticina]OAV94510.1 hypothetical protein PTTG_03024 [Puccinia triticina 1-1 BBBD Race 1]OAV94511.1 hypothetical protein, variant [Puccinia triticina 1-1 BBBD Race 1]WAQ90419.1 hypothetical protein PtA15_12A408 [Puccinia triticina]WAR61735.1 hypothetical protein PtB15_12B425 [Puccinia triticina]